MAAYEFAAATYHWTHDYIEHELTDELLVLYIDAAVDRQAETARVRFADDVEAVRAGTIFAHDQKQYGRWQAAEKRRSGTVVGITLDDLAREFPRNVVH